MTPTRDDIVAICESYWARTSVPQYAIDDLRGRLEADLAEAQRRGKPPTAVIGRDIEAYAERLASGYRVPPPRTPAISPVDRTRARRWDFVDAFVWVAPVAVAVVLLIWFGPKEEAVDDLTLWRWLWVGITVFLGVGEMLTAGFFMLPFAVGAAAAATLAWFDVGVPLQLATFIGVSLVALWGIRRFAWSDREPSYPVGSKRFMNATGVVIEDIEKAAGTGRVRVDTEDWRATTDLAGKIAAGTEVRVVDIRGARLVVEPRDGER